MTASGPWLRLGGPLTWLCPLGEPNEVLALEALMDVWFPGNEGRPATTSHLAHEPSSPTVVNPAVPLANDRGRANRDVRCQPHRAIGGGADLTSLSMDLVAADADLCFAQAAAAELIIRWLQGDDD